MPNTTRGLMTRAGFTLVELIVVLVVMGVLFTMAVPTFRRSIEQSRADAAVANLRAVWAAQRYYWIANRTYASSLTDLSTARLIDPSLLPNSGTDPGWYAYTTGPDGSGGFTVTATLTVGASTGDAFQMDASGNLSGTVHGSDGTVITPTMTQ